MSTNWIDWPAGRDAARPHCCACEVDMWLTRIGGVGRRETFHFQYQVCGARALVRAGHDNVKNIEERL